MIYLDHAATTPINLEVLNFMTKSFIDDFANPSSGHKLGKNLKSKIDELRLEFLKKLGGQSGDHFYFTSSATESNNTVIKGLNLNQGDIVIYSKADHKSLVNPIEDLEALGIQLIALDHNHSGEIVFDFPTNLEGSRVKLLALTLVNNQSGNILDLEQAIQFKMKFPNAHLHLDAVQGIGKVNFKLHPMIDSLSLTSHKMKGPKNVAGLFLKKNHKVKAFIVGGGQQDNFRSSTECFTLDAAFSLAFEKSLIDLENKKLKLEILKQKLEKGLSEINSQIEFPFKNTSPYILCFILKGLSSDIIIRHLETKDIYISSTSACSSKIKGFNSTLDALRIPEKFHKNVLRISLSDETSPQEIDDFLKHFHAVWNEIKHLVK